MNRNAKKGFEHTNKWNHYIFTDAAVIGQSMKAQKRGNPDKILTKVKLGTKIVLRDYKNISKLPKNPSCATAAILENGCRFSGFRF